MVNYNLMLLVIDIPRNFLHLFPQTVFSVKAEVAQLLGLNCSVLGEVRLDPRSSICIFADFINKHV